MAMVHLMRERRDDGWSFAMIADAFNGDHLPGKNGGKWYGAKLDAKFAGDKFCQELRCTEQWTNG